MTQIGLLQSQLGNEIRIVLQDIQKNGQLPCIHASISVTQTFHTHLVPMHALHLVYDSCPRVLSDLLYPKHICFSLWFTRRASWIIQESQRGMGFAGLKLRGEQNACLCVCVCVTEREKEPILQWNMTWFYTLKVWVMCTTDQA